MNELVGHRKITTMRQLTTSSLSVTANIISKEMCTLKVYNIRVNAHTISLRSAAWRVSGSNLQVELGDSGLGRT